jgi:undecaprenyl diphosphate synthase
MLKQREKIDELKVCVRIFGDISLLPKDLQKVIAQVMDMTKDNDK